MCYYDYFAHVLSCMDSTYEGASTFEFVDKTLKCGHSNKSFLTVNFPMALSISQYLKSWNMAFKILKLCALGL